MLSVVHRRNIFLLTVCQLAKEEIVAWCFLRTTHWHDAGHRKIQNNKLTKIFEPQAPCSFEGCFFNSYIGFCIFVILLMKPPIHWATRDSGKTFLQQFCRNVVARAPKTSIEQQNRPPPIARGWLTRCPVTFFC